MRAKNHKVTINKCQLLSLVNLIAYEKQQSFGLESISLFLSLSVVLENSHFLPFEKSFLVPNYDKETLQAEW